MVESSLGAAETPLLYADPSMGSRLRRAVQLVNHPLVSGRAAPVSALETLVERLTSDDRMWFARLDEIAAHVRGLDRPVVTHQPYELP